MTEAVSVAAGLNGDITVRSAGVRPEQPPAGPDGAWTDTPIADSLAWLLADDDDPTTSLRIPEAD